MSSSLRRVLLPAAAASLSAAAFALPVPLLGGQWVSSASASVVDVCDEGVRSVADVKESMQPFVDTVEQAIKAGEISPKGRVETTRLAGRAYHALLVAVSRIDSVNSLEDLGAVTEEGTNLVGAMQGLANAIATSDYRNVVPKVDQYNEAQAVFFETCQDSVTGQDGAAGPGGLGGKGRAPGPDGLGGQDGATDLDGAEEEGTKV